MRVYRSHVRMFLFGIVGVLLIVAAIDVMFAHWLSEPPENNDGVLTTRGQAQQRGDIVWGAAMIGTGTLLVGGAFFDLVRRKPVAQVGSTGLVVAIGPSEGDVEIPWSNVRDVYATSRVDPYDGTTRNKLVVSVQSREALPHNCVGAEWDGSDLVIDAHDWTKSLDDVVTSCHASLGHHRRMDEFRQAEAPSMTWETTVTTAGEPDAATAEVATAPPEEADTADTRIAFDTPDDDEPEEGDG